MQDFYVLQRRRCGESGWLLEVFSRQQGRRWIIISERHQGELLTRYQGDWQAGHDWPRIKLMEAVQHWPLRGESLFCSMYLNELLVRLLPPEEPQSPVFDAYHHTLAALHEHHFAEPWLRMFEYRLLGNQGYQLNWHLDSRGNTIQSDRWYDFEPTLGLVDSDSGRNARRFAGKHLLEIHRGELNHDSLLVAKRVLRQALNAQLSRPLLSRQLFDCGWRQPPFTGDS